MSKSREIRQLLWELLRAHVPVQCFEAVVKDVEDDTCTLEPAGDNPEIYKARLTAAVDDKDSYFVVVPKVGSTVLALVLNNDPKSTLVVAVQEVEEVRFKVGEMTFKTDAEGHVFNSGDLGGLPIIANIVNRLNILEDRVGSHQHLSAAPGIPTAVDPATNAPLTNTTIEDLENPLVKH